MNDKLTLAVVITAELSGKRLDQALATVFPEHSRSRLQQWIKNGCVFVNDRRLRQRDPVHAGDCMVVHPGAGNREHTLLNALLHYDPGLGRLPRAGIVQRLDKDTTGIMVVARNAESHTYLVKQLQARCIKREYLALVAGVMTAGGKVENPIGRHPVHRTRMAVSGKGKPAVTHFQVIKKYPAHTLVRVQLETGRTHQIRVHMASIHYPVVGDPAYGGRGQPPGNASDAVRHALQKFRRQALHACALGLTHRTTGQPCYWEAPLPDDFRSLLQLLDNEKQK